MWGTLCYNRYITYFNRIIPTHVGNTHDASRSIIRSTDHPHACGEHTTRSVSKSICGGSSPRMWGTRRNGIQNVERVRIIPTHVGNTIRRQTQHLLQTDHPHACGEHYNHLHFLVNLFGSSPRMWGTLFFLPRNI